MGPTERENHIPNVKSRLGMTVRSEYSEYSEYSKQSEPSLFQIAKSHSDMDKKKWISLVHVAHLMYL